MKDALLITCLCAALCACATPAAAPTATSAPAAAAPAAAPAAPAPTAASAPAADAPAADAPAAATNLSPSTVCANHGVKGGAVALYPRIIPREASPKVEAVADALQLRLRDTIAAAMPGKPIETCPKPQRVCPQGGCDGLGVGVLLLHKGDSCAALGLINTPGRSIIKIVEWGGKTDLKLTQVEYREPPESQVIVNDFIPCDELLDNLQERTPALIQAIQSNAALVQ
jgi:hypothetical protein